MPSHNVCKNNIASSLSGSGPDCKARPGFSGGGAADATPPEYCWNRSVSVHNLAVLHDEPSVYADGRRLEDQVDVLCADVVSTEAPVIADAEVDRAGAAFVFEHAAVEAASGVHAETDLTHEIGVFGVVGAFEYLFQGLRFLAAGDVHDFAAAELDADGFANGAERRVRDAAVDEDDALTGAVDGADGALHIRREAYVTGVPAQCIGGDGFAAVDAGREVAAILGGDLDAAAPQALCRAVDQRHQRLKISDEAALGEHAHIVICAVDVACAVGAGSAASLCV